MTEPFHYGAQLEQMTRLCPPLGSVEPESVRLLMAGFLFAWNERIEALEREVAALQTEVADLRALAPLADIARATEDRS